MDTLLGRFTWYRRLRGGHWEVYFDGWRRSPDGKCSYRTWPPAVPCERHNEPKLPPPPKLPDIEGRYR